LLWEVGKEVAVSKVGVEAKWICFIFYVMLGIFGHPVVIRMVAICESAAQPDRLIRY
jgi:hypothetical protein